MTTNPDDEYPPAYSHPPNLKHESESVGSSGDEHGDGLG